MAVGTILLWPGPVTLPDGSAGNAAPFVESYKSAGSPLAEGCAVHFEVLSFDTDQNRSGIFGFPMPSDYGSGATLKIKFRTEEADAGKNIVWQAALAAATPNAGETLDNKVYAAPDVVVKAITNLSFEVLEATLALPSGALDGVAPGDWVSLMFGRRPGHASDTGANFAELLALSLEYTPQ